SLRRMMTLIAHAEGVLCLCSLPMLLASAFRVPCVAVGGGLEDPWLHAGTGVTYLHTIGKLPCCARSGCRCSAVLPAHDAADFPAGWLCARPKVVGDQPVGECMTILTPDVVLGALRAAKRRPPGGHHISSPSLGVAKRELPVFNGQGGFQ